MQFRVHVQPDRRRTLRVQRFAPLVLHALLVWTLTADVHAHGVDYRVEGGAAVVVHFSSQQGGAVTGAGFRVFTPDGQRVFVRGNTDARGRAVFVPDRPGNWRLLMATEDGHGAEVAVVVDADEVAALPAQDSDPSTEPAMKTDGISATAAGVGYLLGLGGLLALWRQRRWPVSPTRHR